MSEEFTCACSASEENIRPCQNMAYEHALRLRTFRQFVRGHSFDRLRRSVFLVRGLGVSEARGGTATKHIIRYLIEELAHVDATLLSALLFFFVGLSLFVLLMN